MNAEPITPVGKLFKPALVVREIKAHVAEEASRLGVDVDRVSVRQDIAHRYTAMVSLSCHAEPLWAALASFPF